MGGEQQGKGRGSKGSFIYITQMMGCAGQQNVALRAGASGGGWGGVALDT